MLTTIGRRLDQLLMGPLPPEVRRNLRIETFAGVTYGIFYATAILFMPVVLRKLGGSATLLAVYTAQTYLGSILATLSVLFMRRSRPLVFAVTCWLIGRSLLLGTFFITEARWLLVLTAVFWLLEALPAPAYARIIQIIYPLSYRGRALAIVRMGMVLAILIATPLAGLGLDYVGYQLLIPIASVIGIGSTLLFTRIRIDAAASGPQQAGSLRSIWAILGQNRRFAIYLFGFSLYGLGFLMGVPLFTVVQVDRLQLSYTEIGALGLVQSLFWLFGNLYWGRLLDRHGGMWVVRTSVAIALLVPFSYIWAFNAWTLLPAFIAVGIISAGVDLGILTVGIELADPDRVVEYSALQATVIGLRGMVGPFIGIGLLSFGLSDRIIFALGCSLIMGAWLCLGLVSSQPSGFRALLKK